MLKRVQAAEEDLNTARDLIQQLASKLSQKEREMEAKVVELKTQHEKELSRLGQENYVLQSKVLYNLVSCAYRREETLLLKIESMLLYMSC